MGNFSSDYLQELNRMNGSPAGGTETDVDTMQDRNQFDDTAEALSVSRLIRKAADRGASDVHLIKGLHPKCRLDGQLLDLDERVLTHADCESIAKRLAGRYYDQISEIGELDLALTIAGERVRINLFRQQGSVSAALRILSDRIPELETLGLPEVVYDFPRYNKGIVLVTGETGSGKSTTLAALLDRINHTRQEHIVTLEDPIEYIYKPDKCIINQREIGKDTRSYDDGLRAVLREDPDIILIGEMRDPTTIETALMASETGHLVFATLHTNSAVDSVDRMVGVFPEERQPQIRMELSTSLKAVLSQQLLLRAGGKGRILACEVMIATPSIRNLIREGKTPQMQSAMMTAASEGSITMDNFLLRLVDEHKVTPQTAYEACNDRTYFRKQCPEVDMASDYGTMSGGAVSGSRMSGAAMSGGTMAGSGVPSGSAGRDTVREGNAGSSTGDSPVRQKSVFRFR